MTCPYCKLTDSGIECFDAFDMKKLTSDKKYVVNGLLEHLSCPDCGKIFEKLTVINVQRV